jgi:hypothetical protein
MRLLNPAKMARDVRNNLVGRAEFLAYCLIFAIGILFSIALLAGISDYYVYESGLLHLLDVILVAAAGLGTLYIAYNANRQGDGRNFWYRYISINIPILLLMVIGAFVLGILFGIVDIAVGTTTFDGTYSYDDLAIELVFAIFVLYMTHKYMRLAAQG